MISFNVFYHGDFTLHDVIDTNGNFLSFELFQQRYGIKCNFLEYFQAISAIQSAIRQKARVCAKPNVNFLCGGSLLKLRIAMNKFAELRHLLNKLDMKKDSRHLIIPVSRLPHDGVKCFFCIISVCNFVSDC